MDDLKKQAEELGIKIDGRWNEERLQQEIDKALGAEAPRTNSVAHGQRTFVYKIKRDYWDDEGNRHRKWKKGEEGGLVELTAEQAQDGVEAGALERVK